MYFWQVNALVEDLKARRVSQRQKMYYYLAYTLLTLIAVDVAGLVATELNFFVVLNSLLGVLITVGGILLCYEANSQGDDAEFIDRMVCLSWPISLRMFVVLIPVVVIYGLILASATGETETGIGDVLIMTFYLIYFYKWLHFCILKVSQAIPATDPGAAPPSVI